jgi:AmmeMemoRadiSam system protein B
MFGVSHKARKMNIQDKLVFDDFDAWRGPYGDCPVSDMRTDVINAMPEELVLVSGEMHAEEHSLEAFIPFLQYPGWHGDTGRRMPPPAPVVEILPILVTRMRGPNFEETADTLAAVLYGALSKRGLRFGRDVVFLISADCVHYGDEGWGERHYSPFGVDQAAYDKAVRQDLEIIRTSLVGTIGEDRITLFREHIERDDFQWPYKVTWCGVYSIPFGLRVLARLSERAGRAAPQGFLLRYGTSLDPGALPLEGTGLGRTNINTLRHWVGYTALGYW